MSYRALPFRKPPSGKGYINGELVAPQWKRFVSAVIDYGPGAWVIYIALETGTSQITLGVVVGLMIFVNTIVIAGRTGQSLGHFLTRTCVVTATTQRLRRPDPGKMTLRFGSIVGYTIIFLLNVREAGGGPGQDTLPQLFVGLTNLALIVVAVVLPLADPLRRCFPDFIAGTVVVNRVIKFSPGGGQLRDRQKR